MRSETTLYITLGLVGLASVAIAVVSGSVPAGSKLDPFAEMGQMRVIKYVRSGHLAADARTFVAMFHYFFQAEHVTPTNGMGSWPTERSVAMPTNNAPGQPKA
jgi:hypothetical protein